MKVRQLYFRITTYLLLTFLIFTSVENKAQEKISNADYNRYIIKIMQDLKWYLWQDSLDVSGIDTTLEPEKFIKKLRFSKYDRWSYVEKEKDFYTYYNNCQYVGHGFGRIEDNEKNWRIGYVFEDSPMDKAGIKRGYKLLEINDTAVSYITKNKLWGNIYGANKVGKINSFKFEDLGGKCVSVKIPKAVVKENTIFCNKVFVINGVKIGYVVLHSFLNPAKEGLDSAFRYLKNQGVDELIFDLRYNTGGNLPVSQHAANLIAGNIAENKLYLKMKYNDAKQYLERKLMIKKLNNSLNIKRVIFITSKRTASASECLINGLKPHMNVTMIGTKTSGKPVGMHTFSYKGIVIVPICFQLVNVDEEGDYFDGMKPDFIVEEDFTKHLGDESEPCLKEAIHFIKYGGFSKR